MGKSSASLKRKRSKNSSKAKASSRSKTGKYKSKKVRRLEVSLSSSDYDDSISVDTSALSSSEDSYRRKKDRSRKRKDVKGRKKKARRRSYSRDSNENSLYARKRKKVKRKNEYEVREKPYKKKKIRREASVSSMSSGSWSCSTCQGGSAGSDDSQYESHRGRSERKEKDKRGRSGSVKSSRYRARSCSSYSHCSESCDEGNEEKYRGENNSRWLRSVITVTKEAEESGELCRNGTKEEIVDDHDYPCRSNDSNDGGSKREVDHHTFPASKEKLRVEGEIGEKNSNFNFMEPKIVGRSYSDRSNLKVYSAGTSESLEKKTNGTTGANLDGDDLESILRQRALENLQKFRGEMQYNAKASDQKGKIVSQEKQPIANKHELVRGKSIVNNAAVGTNLNKQTPVEETSLPVRRRNLIAYNERILNMDEDISGSANNNLACAPEKVIAADNPSETVKESTNHKPTNPALTRPESCHELLRSHSSLQQTPVSGHPPEDLGVAESFKDRGTSDHVVSHSSNYNVNNIRGLSSAVLKPSIQEPKFRHNNMDKGQDEVKERTQFEFKQTSASNEPPNAKLLVSEGDVEKNAAKTNQAAVEITNSNNSCRDVDESHNSATPQSYIESSSVENNSGKLQDESNQGSQFEQKTMNVMRGGEMVQVSYKVYIPKKAPALAKRQLKR